jgi:hypothetical protein
MAPRAAVVMATPHSAVRASDESMRYVKFFLEAVGRGLCPCVCEQPVQQACRPPRAALASLTLALALAAVALPAAASRDRPPAAQTATTGTWTAPGLFASGGAAPSAGPPVVFYLVGSRDDARLVERHLAAAGATRNREGARPSHSVLVVRTPQEEARAARVVADATDIAVSNGAPAPRVVDLRRGGSAR